MFTNCGNRCRSAWMLAVIAGLVPSVVLAQTFTEPGDAFSLIPGAPTVGAGAITRINGSLGNGNDGDVYAIRITNPAAFTASTVGQTSIDTQLFLFDAQGRGIVMCDDAAAGVFQSTIGGSLVPAPGVYYLLVTSYDNDPASNGAQMWNDQPYVGQRSPDGPGATGVFNSYAITGGAAGSYGINLTGAEFVTNTLNQCPPNMRPEHLEPVGGGPVDLVTGDFNLDGKMDVITCNYTSNNCTFMQGNGDGTFQNVFNSAVGYLNPTAIAAGDINRDGRLDVVTSNFSSHNVSVKLWSGSGFSTTVLAYPVGTNPTDVAVGDVNRDGIPDIVTTNGSSATISVLIGTGSAPPALFTPAVSYPVGDSPASLALADMDGDGVLDAVVGCVSSIRVLRGNPNGTFQAAVSVSTAHGQSIAVGDLNRDSKLDIVGGDYNNDSVAVLMGTGSATSFQAALMYAVQDGPISVQIADANSDGEPDVVIGHATVYSTEFLLGMGGGALERMPFTGLGGGNAATMVDLNGDTKLDLVTCLYPSNSIVASLQNAGPEVPAFLSQPVSRSILSGQSTTFSVALASSLYPQNLRWRRNGVPLFNDAMTTGVTGPTLTVTGAAMTDSGAVFDCVVSNACGSTTSASASLVVTPSCTADFNRDGTMNSQDFFDFVTAFFTGCP